MAVVSTPQQQPQQQQMNSGSCVFCGSTTRPSRSARSRNAERLVSRDEPADATANHRLRRRPDGQAMLAIVSLAARLAQQVLALLADAVHHREGPLRIANRRADVVVAAHESFDGHGLVDRHRPQLGRPPGVDGAAKGFALVLFDVPLQVGCQAIDLRLVEADHEEPTCRRGVRVVSRDAGRGRGRPCRRAPAPSAARLIGQSARLWIVARRSGIALTHRAIRASSGVNRRCRIRISTPDSVGGNGTGMRSR